MLHTWSCASNFFVTTLVDVFLTRMTAVTSQQLPIMAACNPASKL